VEQRRDFICPNCGKQTAAAMPKEHAFSNVSFLNVVTCERCNKKFLIENQKLKKRAA